MMAEAEAEAPKKPQSETMKHREKELLAKPVRNMTKYQRRKRVKILDDKQAQEELEDLQEAQRSLAKRHRQETWSEPTNPCLVSSTAPKEAVDLQPIEHQDVGESEHQSLQGEGEEDDPDVGEGVGVQDVEENDSGQEEHNNEDKVVKRLLVLIKENPSMATEEMASRFQQLRLKHHTSHEAAEACWLYAWRFCQVLLELRDTDFRPKKKDCRPLVSYRTSRTLASKDMPRISITTLHRNCDTGAYVEDRDMEVYPKSRYEDPKKWRICYSIAEVKLRDVMDHFDKSHAHMPHPLSMVLSLDGVPESKSGISLEVLSVKVEGCARVYPLKVIRPTRQECKELPRELKLNIHRKMSNVLEEINSLAQEGRATLRLVVADAPMRASIRMQKQHGAYYSCDYCTERATAMEIFGQPKRVFPYKKRTLAYPRTTPHMLLLAELYEGMSATNRKKEGDKLFGVQGRSPLFALPGFDVINGVVADAMHLLYMGVVKKLVTLTFRTGPYKKRATAQQRVDIGPLSEGLLQVLVPSEFPRGTKAYDAYWKASEYRNLLVAFFPLVVDCIPTERRQERTLWLLLAYLTRACILSDEEYRTFSQAKLKQHHDHFYKLFTNLFGEKNCSYNIHVFSHLQTIRRQGKLQKTSAFPFEASYGILKESYCPGTTSPGKQAMTRLLSRYGPIGHKCERNLTHALRLTRKKNDSIVHCRDGQFYRLLSLPNDQHACFYGMTLHTEKYVPDRSLGLAFEEVGVFMLNGDQPRTEATVIEQEDIVGKGIIVPTSNGEALVSLPTDFLQECLAC